MLGSTTVQPINGKWDHVGYLDTEHVMIPAGVTLPKGTHFMASPTSDEKAVLASGDAIGFTTQMVDNEGHTSTNARLRAAEGIGAVTGDWPIKKGEGKCVSLRRMNDGSEIEFEGLGTSSPGNIVCTSGTGSISTGTTRGTSLSVHNGCIRVAQTGDRVLYKVLQADLTPKVTGRVRIRVEKIGKPLMA